MVKYWLPINLKIILLPITSSRGLCLWFILKFHFRKVCQTNKPVFFDFTEIVLTLAHWEVLRAIHRCFEKWVFWKSRAPQIARTVTSVHATCTQRGFSVHMNQSKRSSTWMLLNVASCFYVWKQIIFGTIRCEIHNLFQLRSFCWI